MSNGELFWRLPPAAGYFAEDLDELAGLPPHTELIDGSLVFMSPEQPAHMTTAQVIEEALTALAPARRFLVRRDIPVVLGRRQRVEPDVLVLRGPAEVDPATGWFPAESVVLAVEVVSPDSEERDRKRKPLLYAEAGIPFLWRLENISGKVALYAYELDPATRQYVAAGIFHDRIRLAIPFEIDIDLTTIT